MTDAVAGAGLAVGLGGALVGGLCVGAALLGLRRATDAVSAATPALDEAERTRRLLRVLLRALPKASKKTREVDVALDVAADGAVQLRLEGGDERARQRVAEAADQTLRGCPAPHYAIEVFSPAAPSGGWRSDAGEAAFTSAGFLPVPSALGTSRRVAEAWAEAWRAELGPCELVAVRKQRATDALPWRDPASLRWLRASARRGDTRRALR